MPSRVLQMPGSTNRLGAGDVAEIRVLGYAIDLVHEAPNDAPDEVFSTPTSSSADEDCTAWLT